MDLSWLEDFTALARTLSFSRAAQERGMTQSAFSRRIRSLENWTGAALIDRSTYPVRLSAAGEAFLPVARDTLLGLLRARDDLREMARGDLRLCGFAAPHAISVTHLAAVLARLERSTPVRSTTLSADLPVCCQALEEGACDFLLCYRHPAVVLALDESAYERIDIGVERLLPVCAPGPGGAARWALPPQDDAAVPYLAYTGGSFLGGIVAAILRRAPLSVELRHANAFAGALKGLALSGAGVAWLPERSVADALASGTLVIAGDARWHEGLTVSAFAAPGRLDGAGEAVWRALKVMADAKSVTSAGASG